MAELTLGTYELNARPLPAVCACCGAPVAVWKPQTFSWYRKWVIVTILAGLLVFVILAMVLTKRARMQVPLCEKHRNHFLSRVLLTWLGFAGIFVVVLLCAAVAGHHAAVWLAVPVYFVGWLVAAAIA